MVVPGQALKWDYEAQESAVGEATGLDAVPLSRLLTGN